MEENKVDLTQGDSVNDYYLALKKIEEEKEAKKKENKKKKRIGCGTAVLVLFLLMIVNAIVENIPKSDIAVTKAECASCTDGYLVCSTCNEGEITCTTCKGELKVVCTNCNSDGKELCGTCDASGKVYDKCSYCGGNGKVKLDCENCNGRGWVHNYTVDVLGEDVACMHCNGSGKKEPKKIVKNATVKATRIMLVRTVKALKKQIVWIVMRMG